ncbi:MAG: hypothetical protein IJF24_04205 [Clostridia bacterium]|nr:hypothetical protein [Clostridia bacterium]
MKTDLIGNLHITTPLTRAVREGRTAGAYLIEGPSGSGKKTLASVLCALFLCSDVSEDGACGVCRDCENLAVGSHPDLFVFTPEKDREFISVDTVRRANEAAQTAPIHAARRVFLIPDVAKLNASAQNALLKNLEEPSRTTVYLLLCEEAAGVLATIRSRCVIFRTELFSNETLTEELGRRFKGEDPSTLTLAARLSGGALGQAIAFLSDKKMEKCRKLAYDYLSLVRKGAGFDALSCVLSADVKKEILPLFYRVLLSGVRDLLLNDKSEQRQFFAPEEPLSHTVSDKTLLALCDRLLDLTDPSMTNANVAASVYSLNSVASGV